MASVLQFSEPQCNNVQECYIMVGVLRTMLWRNSEHLFAGSRQDMPAVFPQTNFLQTNFFFIQRFRRHMMGKHYEEGRITQSKIHTHRCRWASWGTAAGGEFTGKPAPESYVEFYLNCCEIECGHFENCWGSLGYTLTAIIRRTIQEEQNSLFFCRQATAWAQV
jgi:hypothetical protein